MSDDAAGAAIARLIDNQAAIRRNYLDTIAAEERGDTITPAAEWLIDNHHMVEENLRQLRQAFGPAFLHRLPAVPLSGGGTAPRALLLAWYFVALTNSEITADDLTSFLRGYQSVQTLTIAELWAVPTFLRYVLVENLRRLSDRPILTTCGSGVTAAVINLALASVGAENHRLYDGSWSEWGGRPDTPVVTGPADG